MKPLTFTRGAALVGAVMLSHASVALAAGGESTPLHLSTTVSTTHAASGGSSSIVRTIVGLFVVIAVIYGITWVLRQAKGGKSRASGHGLSQLATLPLGNGKSVALVRAGQEIVLVGVSEQAVTPIRTYTEAEALSLGIDLPVDDSGRLAPEGEQRPAGRFADTLRRLTVRS
jgi:flagellar protein FliO/FliZ